MAETRENQGRKLTRGGGEVQQANTQGFGKKKTSATVRENSGREAAPKTNNRREGRLRKLGCSSTVNKQKSKSIGDRTEY